MRKFRKIPKKLPKFLNLLADPWLEINFFCTLPDLECPY